MKVKIKSLLVALCVMSLTVLWADTSLQIQDSSCGLPGASGYDSIIEEYKQDMQGLQDVFNDSFLKQPQGGTAYRMFDSEKYPQGKYNKTKEAYTLTFATPGMSKENISVTITNQVLTVSGNYNKKSEKKDNSSRYEEQLSGQFSQSINLPKDVITSKITSKYENGVLTVTLPRELKKVQDNTKTIKID